MLYSSVPIVGAIHPSLEGFLKGPGPGHLGKPSHQAQRGFFRCVQPCKRIKVVFYCLGSFSYLLQSCIACQQPRLIPWGHPSSRGRMSPAFWRCSCLLLIRRFYPSRRLYTLRQRLNPRNCMLLMRMGTTCWRLQGRYWRQHVRRLCL